MEILSTTDYDKFKLIESNREVNQPHLQKIIASIKEKNLLHVSPITVNANFEVLDGQHRLAAAQILQLPIYYIISESITSGDISRLNANRKNWSMLNYLEYYHREGYPEYRQISKFQNSYNKIPLTAILKMLNPEGAELNESFKNGVFKITSYETAEKIASQICQLSVYGKHVYGMSFIIAYCRIFFIEGFDFGKLVYQIDKNPRGMVAALNTKTYAQILNDLYNRDVRSSNRLNLAA